MKGYPSPQTVEEDGYRLKVHIFNMRQILKQLTLPLFSLCIQDQHYLSFTCWKYITYEVMWEKNKKTECAFIYVHIKKMFLIIMLYERFEITRSPKDIKKLKKKLIETNKKNLIKIKNCMLNKIKLQIRTFKYFDLLTITNCIALTESTFTDILIERATSDVVPFATVVGHAKTVIIVGI